ncbi:MAG: hypothetical protein ACR2Q3_10445 [Woeseiaceae bacterium]
MKKYIRKITLGCASALLAGTAGLATAAPLESVLGLDVHNPGAFLSALEKFYRTNDSQSRKVTIWSVAFGGETDTSHLAVATYDGYEDYQNSTDRLNASSAWGQFVGSLDDVLDVKSRVMAVERFREGSGWRDHGASTAFVMAISDPGAYASAFEEFVDATDNPGSVRLVELRFGGQGATHAVVISAEDTVALNEYLDDLLSSDEYRRFVGKVGDIRTILNVSMYNRVASFGN